MNLVHDFLEEIDQKWVERGGAQLIFKIFGSTSLFLQTEYERGTKDSDIFRTDQMDNTVRDALLKIAGESTKIHKKIQFLPGCSAPEHTDAAAQPSVASLSDGAQEDRGSSSGYPGRTGVETRPMEQ